MMIIFVISNETITILAQKTCTTRISLIILIKVELS